MVELDEFLQKEKERLLKRYRCITIEELLQKLEQLLQAKNLRIQRQSHQDNLDQ